MCQSVYTGEKCRLGDPCFLLLIATDIFEKSYYIFVDIQNSPEFNNKIIIFQHWIRLEMQPDILIKTLKMGVDPADNSYMPSVIVINGGHSINAISELNVVNVKSHDTSVLLLSNLDKVIQHLVIHKNKTH